MRYALHWSPLTLCAALLVGACGTKVPEIQEIWATPTDGQLLVNEIVNNVTCELQDAVNYVFQQDARAQAMSKDHYSSAAFLDTWGAQMTLNLKVEEKSAFNPSLNWFLPNLFTLGVGGGISADATRTDQMNSYHTVKELRALGFCNPRSRTNGTLLLRSDLKLKEWLFDSVMESGTGEINMPTTTTGPFKQNVLSHEIKFEIISNGSISPGGKLILVAVNQPGPLVSGSRDRTHDLLITFGPTDTTTPTPSPGTAAANVHQASLIGLDVANAVRSALQP